MNRAENRAERRDSVAKRTIEGLKEFSEWLESGSPPGVFRITDVRRVETHDGPMHLRTVVDKGSVKDERDRD